MTKLEMRRPVIEKLLNNREADLNQFVSFCTSPEVQKSLEFYLETLKKKKWNLKLFSILLWHNSDCYIGL